MLQQTSLSTCVEQLFCHRLPKLLNASSCSTHRRLGGWWVNMKYNNPQAQDRWNIILPHGLTLCSSYILLFFCSSFYFTFYPFLPSSLSRWWRGQNTSIFLTEASVDKGSELIPLAWTTILLEGPWQAEPWERLCLWRARHDVGVTGWRKPSIISECFSWGARWCELQLLPLHTWISCIYIIIYISIVHE